MRLRIMLEWFKNPDHLPFIYGQKEGLYEQENLEVELIEPTEHYDGFTMMQQGVCELAITEPLHLVEHYTDGLVSLGCFFETTGGVLVRNDAMEKLRQGEVIRLSTPASNPFTNTLAQQLFDGYAKQAGWKIPVRLQINQTDFYHIEHLKQGYDAAWLCFENFEGVQSKLEGLDVTLFGPHSLGLPNVSALELTTTRAYLDANREPLGRFLKATNAAIRRLQADRKKAKAHYLAESPQKGVLMEATLEDTIGRFCEIAPGAEKWRQLFEWIRSLGLAHISNEQYEETFPSIEIPRG